MIWAFPKMAGHKEVVRYGPQRQLVKAAMKPDTDLAHKTQDIYHGHRITKNGLLN